MAPLKYLRSKKICAGLFLIRQNSFGGVRRLGSLLWPNRCVKDAVAWSMGKDSGKLAAGSGQHATRN